MLTGLIHCAKCGGAMTIRTGKGGRYRYYACSMKARQGPTACEGMAVPMEKLDDLVADHLENQFLQPERLETVLAAALDRREEHAERRREHIAELNKRSTESELRLKRLYDAIEAGVADLDDPALKDRIDGLKVIRDQAKADADRAQAMLQNSGQKAVTPQMLRKFATTARQRIRLDGGGYRRDHLRALAQRVEVAEGEVRIMGSKSRLLQTLVAGSGVNSVPTQGLNWRRGCDRIRTDADLLPGEPGQRRASHEDVISPGLFDPEIEPTPELEVVNPRDVHGIADVRHLPVRALLLRAGHLIPTPTD